MSEIRARVAESAVNALARRAARLSDLVERATQTSLIKEIREGGSQLVEVLGERIEELRELHALEDDDLADKMRIFSIRLRLAEEKVQSWKLPKPVRKSEGGRARKSVKSAA